MPKLFAIDEEIEFEDDGVGTHTFYVLADDMDAAVSKWRSFIATSIAAELDDDPEDIIVGDPVSVNLVAEESELLL